MRVFALSAILAVGVAPVRGFAFHSGGVAECDGCHTMHNSSDLFENDFGVPKPQMTTTARGVGNANPYLLQGSDPSSTCLVCHQAPAGTTAPTGFYISTPKGDMPAGSPPNQLTPGGDFGWLEKSYSWSPDASDWTPNGARSPGDRHGHNIVAVDFDYQADTSLTAAPGGSYPAESLSCISCHDPHGRYRMATVTPPTGVTFATSGKPIRASGSYGEAPDATTAVGTYRLLGGVGYVPRSLAGVADPFVDPPFVAVAPADYNRSEAISDTRVAYGRNVSRWCSNCHGAMHMDVDAAYVHPIDDTLGPGGESVAYNRYVNTGNKTGGGIATAYLSLVPFQVDNSSDVAGILKTIVTVNPGQGPATNDRVMCLSCHRAHASGFSSITRWSMDNEFITLDTGDWLDPVTHPAQAQGRTKLEMQRAYYDRPASRFGHWQRSLCNKCHVKD